MKERILSMLLCISMVIMLFADFIQPIDIDLNIFAWASGETADGSEDNTTGADPEEGGDDNEGGDSSTDTGFTKPEGCICEDYTEENQNHGNEECPRFGCDCTEEEYDETIAGTDEAHKGTLCKLNPDNIPCIKCGEVAKQHKYTCDEICNRDCTDTDSDGKIDHVSDCHVYVEGTGCTAGCISTKGTANSGLYKNPGKGTEYLHLYYCKKNCDCGEYFETNGKHRYNCITNCMCYLSKTTIPTENTHNYYCPIYKCNFLIVPENEQQKADNCYVDEENNLFVHHNVDCYQYTPPCCDGVGDDDTCEKKINVGSDIITFSFDHVSTCEYYLGTQCSTCNMLGTGRHAPNCSNNKNTSTNITTLLTSLDDWEISAADAEGYITYKLKRDVTLGSTLVIGTEGKYIIDLNGHILSGNGRDTVIANRGKLIITDNSAKTTQHKGRLVDRGYYFFWDTVSHYRNTRVLEDALWVPVADSYTGDDVVTINGGLITGGKLSRVDPTSDFKAPFGVDGYASDQDIANALGVDISVVSAMNEPEKIIAVMSSMNASDYFKKILTQHKRASHLSIGGAGIANIGTSAELTINGGTIAGCETLGTYSGSAVFCEGGADFTLNGGIIKYNYAMGGGAVYIEDDGAVFNFNSGALFENACVAYGALTSRSNTVLNFGTTEQSNDTDANGVADWRDGGLENGKELLDELKKATTWPIPVIHSNRASSITINEGNGGGIYADGEVTLNMHCALIMNNWSHYRGGGVDLYKTGELTMDGDVDVISNYCESKGGGISVHYGFDFTVDEENGNKASLSFNLISNEVNVEENLAGYGGGLYLSHLGLDMKAGYIRNNRALGHYITQANAKIANNWRTHTMIGYDGEIAAIDLNSTSNKYEYYREDANGESSYYNYSNAPKTYTKVEGISVTTAEHGGGGIYFDGKVDVKVSGGEISGNTSRGNGAGIRMSGGTFTISQGTGEGAIPTKITNNRIVYSSTANESGYTDSYDTVDKIPYGGSGDGAGIYLGSGSFTMSGGEITNNVAKNSGGEGGGVSINNGHFVMTGGKITGNVSRRINGGGVHMNGWSGSFDMSGGEITDNLCGTQGGGLSQFAGSFTMSGGTFTRNNANDGGGVFIQDATFTISGGNIDGNTARNHGGGVHLDKNTTFTMSAGSINNNYAAYSGGGVIMGETSTSGGVTTYYPSELIMTGGTISNNTAQNNYGGGIFMYGGTTLSISDGIVSGNTVKSGGGGINMSVNCSFTMVGGSITGNSATGGPGGGIRMDANCTVTMTNGTIANNTASVSGGGVYMGGDSTMTMKGGSVHNNTSTSYGAGVCMSDDGTFIMTDDMSTETLAEGVTPVVPTIYSNTAGSSGGGVYMGNNSIFTMTNGEIYSNTTNKSGAGVRMGNSSLFTMNGGSIYSNTAGESGGGVGMVMADSTFNMNSGSIYRNTAGTHGGGVYVNGTFNMKDGTFTQNKATTGNGGAVNVYMGEFIMHDGTFTDNHADTTKILSTDENPINTENNYGFGGAIAVKAGDCTIYKGNITNNTARYRGGAIFLGSTTNNGTRSKLILGRVDNKALTGGNEFADDATFDVNITDNRTTIDGAQEFKDKSNNYYGGGAIFAALADVDVYNADISDNKVTETRTENVVAGAIWIYNANFNMYGGRLSNNRSAGHWSGAIHMSSGSFTVYDGEICNNYSDDNGGVGYINSGNVYIYDGALIHDNSAKNYVGGAFCIVGGNVYMYGGKVYNNKCTINSNIDGKGGGAFSIHGSGGKFYMYDGEVYGNTSNNCGGAIAFTNSGECYIYGGTVRNNTVITSAERGGGAVFMKSGTLVVGREDCLGGDDTSKHLKEAAPNPPTGDCHCDKSHPIITGNSAANGGAFYIASGTIDVYCGEITGNTASQKGGGIYVNGKYAVDSKTNADLFTTTTATVNLYNATVSGNTAADATSGDNLYMDKANATVTYKNVNTFGTETDPGVIVVNGNYVYEGGSQLVTLYLKDRNGNTLFQASLPEGQMINLPDGEEMFDEQAGDTFLGWQHPFTNEYVDEPSDYKVKGTAVEVIADNYEGAGNTMTLYAVWAPEDNNIYTYDSVQSLTNNSSSTTSTYKYGDKVTIPAAISKSGYTFIGWTLFQNRNKDGNWAIDVGGIKNGSNYFQPSDEDDEDSKINANSTLFDGEVTTKRFGELQFVANWSTEITYTVVGSGKLSKQEETVSDISLDNAIGSKPTADADYIFVGWYTDIDCEPEDEVSPDFVDENGKIIPKVNDETGFYDVLEYYAKFEPRYTELTINTKGTDADQSFVFVVEEAGLTYANAPYGQENATFKKMEVVFAADESGNGTITIKHVPVGSYKVYEKNTTKANVKQQDTWTWRYENTNAVEHDAASSFEFNYNNNPNLIYWLSFYTKKFLGIIPK